MIQEIWDYLTTPAKLETRYNGYLYRSVALVHRAKRCSLFWQTHLDQVQTELKKIISETEQKKSVAVLGSGLMLETPLSLLTENFEQVYLYDVVHTKNIRGRVSEFNLQAGREVIHLIEADLNHFSPSSRIEKEKYDLVISANLLSQIALVEVERISINKNQSQSSNYKHQEELALELQQRHVDLLSKMGRAQFLFSDNIMKVRDVNGKLIEEGFTVSPKIKMPQFEKKWSWDLAPAPEMSKKYSIELEVGFWFAKGNLK